MAKFNVYVWWSVSADMSIEAESLEAAIELAENADLPDDAEYIDGSFEVNEDATRDDKRNFPVPANDLHADDRCATCQVPEHDVCASDPTCPCCVDSMRADG